MCSKAKDICDDYGFRFLDNVEAPAVRLVAVGRESRNSKTYYWDNSTRTPAFIFQYTLNGSGTLKYNNQEHIIKNGEAFFLKIPDNEKYYFDEQINSAPWEFIYIYLEGNAVLPYYNYAIEHFGKIMHLSEFHPAVKAVMELHSKAKNGLIQNAFAADSEAFHILCLLCGTNSNDNEHNSNLTNGAKEYIENNFNNQITLSQVAEHLGISQSHLSREFLKQTGEHPVHYLTKVRLEKAAALLNSTNMNLDDISNICGFANRNYFTKVFKKYMKIPPSEFRKQIQAQDYTSIKV